MWDCTPGNRNQQWTRDGEQWKWTGTNKCLDLPNGDAKPGNFLHIWTCVGNDFQRWEYGGAASPAPAPPAPPPPSGGGTATGAWRQVWADEFNGSSLDESKWAYEDWAPRTVNNELQRYTVRRQENVRVEGGHLVIEARRDGFAGSEYSSGRIKTQGKASWAYGKMEARMQMPGGFGTWPAFWMMPDNQSRGWPACGEIDVLENVGYDQDRVHGTIHSNDYNWRNPSSQRTGSTIQGGVTTGYHTYAIEWSPTEIKWFVDGRQYYQSPNDSGGDDNKWPFNKNFHLILNLAVGGDWGGAQGVDPNIWPRRLLVDYVRVFQK
ncbi:MAG: glycosyl hydrolase family protein [Proteobacteria bacterium]|nr:MAG: glycosyl hydrolase family protein [Pseudomonadota bacterium]